MSLSDPWQILNVIQAVAAAHLVAWHFFTWLGFGCYSSFGGCWPCCSEATRRCCAGKIPPGGCKFSSERERERLDEIGEHHSVLQVDKFLTWLKRKEISDTLLFHQLQISRNSHLFVQRFLFDMFLCQKITFLRELRHLPRFSNEWWAWFVLKVPFSKNKNDTTEIWMPKMEGFGRFVFLLPRVIEL